MIQLHVVYFTITKAAMLDKKRLGPYPSIKMESLFLCYYVALKLM
uniref:Uncharacterized protein n=1 Tax=Anguilla anguilla TaxID=7936 RepID=A0A0E9QZA7_ANGAN